MLKLTMKTGSFKFPLRRLLTLALFCMLAMGACKSKKKAVESAPAPAPVETAPTTPTAPPQPSAEGVAVSRLEGFFSSVANASSIQSANSTIQEALSMFSSQNTPVLNVMREENGVKDDDEHTMINTYLNYLNNTKKNSKFISYIRIDRSGKVSVLELRRR